MKPYHYQICISLFCFLFISCHKQDFLNKKPASAIIIPTTLPELRAMLDNTQVFTFSPGLGELAADDYYITFINWQSLTEIERNSYVWESDLYGSRQDIPDWTIPYQQILYTNIVLQQLKLKTPSVADEPNWKDIKGSALFLRALAYSNLVQHFAASFDSSSMLTDKGVPIRLQADVHKVTERASLKACYDQIFNDLREAVLLLSPVLPPVMKNRPSKPAAYALLARNCLLTGQYQQAKNYADSCLNLYSHLIDYNSISPTAVAPFERSQPEILYYCQAVNIYQPLLTISTTTFADTTLYRMYHTNDLRRQIFYRTLGGSNMGFKRGYGGTILVFTGLTTNEVYLIRAEASARLGLTVAAMHDLNTLLTKRYRTGTYTVQTATTANDALQKVLTERRKELPWRGLRWLDLKRFNKSNTNIELRRVLNNQTYILQPNSPKYIFPIPNNEISLSGIIQNQR